MCTQASTRSRPSLLFAGPTIARKSAVARNTLDSGRHPACSRQRAHRQNIKFPFCSEQRGIFNYAAQTGKHALHFFRQVRRMEPKMEDPFLPNGGIQTLDSSPGPGADGNVTTEP